MRYHQLSVLFGDCQSSTIPYDVLIANFELQDKYSVLNCDSHLWSLDKRTDCYSVTVRYVSLPPGSRRAHYYENGPFKKRTFGKYTWRLVLWRPVKKCAENSFYFSTKIYIQLTQGCTSYYNPGSWQKLENWQHIFVLFPCVFCSLFVSVYCPPFVLFTLSVSFSSC